MKAKVKATGKVIDVTLNKCAMPVQGSGATSIYEGEKGKTYIDTELDFIHLYPDWQQVRIQAAIAAMQGMMADITPERFTIRINEKAVAKASVEYADALIEELKRTM